jgi:hypothetical protein
MTPEDLHQLHAAGGSDGIPFELEKLDRVCGEGTSEKLLTYAGAIASELAEPNDISENEQGGN